MKIIPLIIFVLLCSCLCAQQHGSMDSTFGNNGKYRLIGGNQSEGIHRMRVLPNNNILILSSNYRFTDSTTFQTLSMFKPDGSVDSSFGTNGKAQHQLFAEPSYGSDLLIAPNGKIYFTYYPPNPPYRWVVVCCLANGAVDSTFANNGVFSLQDSNNYNMGRAYSLLYMPTGHLLVGGYTSNYSHSGRFLKLDCSGKIDSAFGINGLTPILDDGFYSSTLALAKILPDGKILTGGNYGHSHGDDRIMILARYNENGLLDSSFGTNGISKLRLQPPYTVDAITDIQILPDGKIIVGGSTGAYAMHFMAARLYENGSLDSTFGINGSVGYNVGNMQDNLIDIYVQPDGKILGMGTTDNQVEPLTTKNVFATRLNPNGTLDSAFGAAGITMLSSISSSTTMGNFEITNEGKMLLAMGEYDYNNNNVLQGYITLVRINTGLPAVQCLPKHHYIYQTICAGESYKYDCNEFTTNTIITDTFVAQGGCDSIVTLQLGVDYNTDTIHATVCNNQQFIFNGTYIDVEGVYTDTLTAAGGCSSTVYLHLNVLPTSIGNNTTAICAGDTFMHHGTAYYQAGTYYDTLVSQSGCDSIVEISLSINSLPTPTISPQGDTLSTSAYISYTWTHDGIPLSDTLPYLVPSQSGSYAVIVTDSNGCTNSAVPVAVTVTGIPAMYAYDVQIVPNPTMGSVIVKTITHVETVTICDNLGRVLYTKRVNGAMNEQLDMSNYSTGVYILRLSDSVGNSITRRVLKQ